MSTLDQTSDVGLGENGFFKLFFGGHGFLPARCVREHAWKFGHSCKFPLNRGVSSVTPETEGLLPSPICPGAFALVSWRLKLNDFLNSTPASPKGHFRVKHEFLLEKTVPCSHFKHLHKSFFSSVFSWKYSLSWPQKLPEGWNSSPIKTN